MRISDVRAMATTLAEQCPEIADRTAARRTLAFAGWNDSEISKYLKDAQCMARQIRGATADELVKRETRK